MLLATRLFLLPTRALLLGWLITCVAFGIAAQEQSEPAASDPLAVVEKQRAAVAEEIRELQQRFAETLPTEAQSERLESLQALERTYTRQRELLRSELSLAQREEAAEERLASGPTGQLSKPPPYVLAVLDALADARDAQREGTRTLEAALEAAQQAAPAAGEAFESAERMRRRAAEAVETAQDPAQAARLGVDLRRVELASRGARARRDLATTELANLERKLALQKRDVRLLEDTVRWVRDNLALDPGANDAIRAQLGDREFETKRGREEAERETANAERRLSEAEQRLEGEPTSAIRAAEVKARGAELRLWQQRAEFATAGLSRIESQRRIEERRLRVLGGEATRSELLAWQAELEQSRAEIERNLRLLEVRRSEIEQELGDARRAGSEADAGARPWLDRRVGALETILSLHSQGRSAWAPIDVLSGRVLAELTERTARPSLGDRLGDLRRAATSFWEFELFAAEDRPITVGKIASGLLLFALGFVVARLASRLLGRLLTRRTTLDTGAATAMQGLVFYVLLVLFFLMALRSVNIPLTAFTVLGGALAIGVGFGSQNIVNNFISGLILLAERPIKVGDVIDVDGERGTVEGIGPRSTRVRTFDNIHIIVPNSAFLEKNVINWTLSDSDVRARVDVGVAYGSPTRDVQKLLRRAIDEHGKILERPEPLVLFRAFGDDALLFRAYFWIRSRDMGERLTIESDIRYRIDHLFREAHISIAFPQRDVHLDASAPLAVRLVKSEESAPTGDS